METKSSRWRLAIFLFCGIFSAAASAGLFHHYRPLARYPYGNTQERKILEERLTSKEIDFLINSQLTPQMIIPFLDSPDFNIENTLYYYTAQKTRSADPQVIVTFVNDFAKRLTYQQLEDYLRWYNYQQLTEFWNFDFQAKLAEDPADLFLILNQNKTVYSWAPEGLVDEDNIILRQEAMSAWNELKAMADIDGFVLPYKAGYISYQQAQQENQENPVKPGYEYPEQQLAASVMLALGPQWDAYCQTRSDSEGNPDYEKVLGMLDENQKLLMDWLENNAWKAGFIIRYPKDKEKVTGHYWQPFVLRYVGKEAAEKIYNEKWSLEEYVKNNADN